MQQEKNKAAYREDCTGDAQDFHRDEFSVGLSKTFWNFRCFRQAAGISAYFFLPERGNS
jgi:hypothetical protein